MIALAALLLAATPPDQRAADAVKLFASLCASSRGSRGVAVARLGDGNDMGRRLLDTEVASLQGGQTGGMAWSLQSPAGAALILDFEPGGGQCSVRVEQADTAALRTAFDGAVRLLAEGFGSVASAPVESRDDGIASVGYTYLVTGRRVSVSLSSSTRPIDRHRHLMSFAFLD